MRGSGAWRDVGMKMSDSFFNESLMKKEKDKSEEPFNGGKGQWLLLRKVAARFLECYMESYGDSDTPTPCDPLPPPGALCLSRLLWAGAPIVEAWFIEGNDDRSPQGSPVSGSESIAINGSHVTSHETTVLLTVIRTIINNELDISSSSSISLKTERAHAVMALHHLLSRRHPAAMTALCRAVDIATVSDVPGADCGLVRKLVELVAKPLHNDNGTDISAAPSEHVLSSVIATKFLDVLYSCRDQPSSSSHLHHLLRSNGGAGEDSTHSDEDSDEREREST